MEPFPEILTHITNAVEKCVSSGPNKDILIKQLTWEGLNIITCNVIITPVRNENIHKWVLATSDIEQAHFQPYGFHQCLCQHQT